MVRIGHTSSHPPMIQGKKIFVVVPAYNAGHPYRQFPAVQDILNS